MSDQGVLFKEAEKDCKAAGAEPKKSFDQIWYEYWRGHMAGKGVNLPTWEQKQLEKRFPHHT